VKIPGVLPPVSVASWPKLFGPEATAASILDSRVAVRSDDAGAPAGDGCGGGVAGEVTGVAAGDEDGAGVGAKPDGAGAEAVEVVGAGVATGARVAGWCGCAGAGGEVVALAWDAGGGAVVAVGAFGAGVDGERDTAGGEVGAGRAAAGAVAWGWAAGAEAGAGVAGGLDKGTAAGTSVARLMLSAVAAAVRLGALGLRALAGWASGRTTGWAAGGVTGVASAGGVNSQGAKPPGVACGQLGWASGSCGGVVGFPSSCVPFPFSGCGLDKNSRSRPSIPESWLAMSVN
jgi:hypothetical protein